MNAKQKADDLFQQMYNKIQTDELGLNYESAKQCAIIAVREILNSSPSLPILGDAGLLSEDIGLSKEYWQEVETELNERD